MIERCENCGGVLAHGNHTLCVQTIGCWVCEWTGWIDDPTACGDDEHCAQRVPCPCNPEMKDD